MNVFGRLRKHYLHVLALRALATIRESLAHTHATANAHAQLVCGLWRRPRRSRPALISERRPFTTARDSSSAPAATHLQSARQFHFIVGALCLRAECSNCSSYTMSKCAYLAPSSSRLGPCCRRRRRRRLSSATTAVAVSPACRTHGHINLPIDLFASNLPCQTNLPNELAKPTNNGRRFRRQANVRGQDSSRS